MIALNLYKKNVTLTCTMIVQASSNHPVDSLSTVAQHYQDNQAVLCMSET